MLKPLSLLDHSTESTMNITSQEWLAFGMTLCAGLTTSIGSTIAFFVRRVNYRFLALSLGFSAGVMVFVSFTEFMPEASASLSAIYGQFYGKGIAIGGFFGGIALIGLIDRMVPTSRNPHEPRLARDLQRLKETPTAARLGHRRLLRVGVLTAAAIAMHNFPEGAVTFLAVVDEPRVGILIAVAIAIHNIPEGISISVPIFYATASRRRAFLYSSLSGLAEPFGALAAYSFLRPFMGCDAIGICCAAVAGVMVFVSLDELLPAACRYGQGHDAIYGIVSGMGVMAVADVFL